MSKDLTKEQENLIDTRVELELDGEITRSGEAYEYVFNKLKNEIIKREYI